MPQSTHSSISFFAIIDLPMSFLCLLQYFRWESSLDTRCFIRFDEILAKERQPVCNAATTQKPDNDSYWRTTKYNQTSMSRCTRYEAR